MKKIFFLFSIILINKYSTTATPVSKNSFQQQQFKATTTVKYDSMWVEYDVSDNGKTGMRIHVKFSVINMKDKDCDLAVYFWRKNGEKLKGDKKGYSTADGQVAVFRNMKPGFDEAFYDDMQLFIPYDELNAGKGKSDLSMEVSVIQPNGALIEHLTDYGFWVDLK